VLLSVDVNGTVCLQIALLQRLKLNAEQMQRCIVYGDATN
jgi:hypothetical protein